MASDDREAFAREYARIGYQPGGLPAAQTARRRLARRRNPQDAVMTAIEFPIKSSASIHAGVNRSVSRRVSTIRFMIEIPRVDYWDCAARA